MTFAPRQEIMGLILSLMVVYAVICAAVYFGNRQLMYFPDPARVPPAEVGLDGVEEIAIAATDGTTLIAWHAPAKEIGRRSFISTAMGPTLPTAPPESRQCSKTVLASSTLTTEAMAVLEDEQEGTDDSEQQVHVVFPDK